MTADHVSVSDTFCVDFFVVNVKSSCLLQQILARHFFRWFNQTGKGDSKKFDQYFRLFNVSNFQTAMNVKSGASATRNVKTLTLRTRMEITSAVVSRAMI